MVKMGTIWDRATEVMSGRGGMLFGIAALTIFLPGVVRTGVALALGSATPVAGIVNLLLVIATLLLTLWGQLAIIAAASDPAVTAHEGYSLGLKRLPAAVAVTLVLLAALFVLSIPFGVALVMGGVDMRALAIAPATVQMSGGTAAFVSLYILALLVIGLFVGARLTLVNPTVLHQRRGLGAFAESWRLTRGLTWRLVGVTLLFVVVLLVATFATQLVVGSIVALVLGRDAAATIVLVTTAVTGLVSTGFTVVALTFVAQLYVALAGPPPLRP